MDYQAFLAKKSQLGGEHGFDPGELPSYLYPFQAALVDWACRGGRRAIFADCGLGKTPMQLTWAQRVIERTNGRVFWLWIGSVNRHGYGNLLTSDHGRKGPRHSFNAHRAYYLRFVGDIPMGYHIDHLCRNRRCVNPSHLEAVSVAVNLRRGIQTRLCEADVAEIRIRVSSGELQRRVAQSFGVHKSHVSKIVSGAKWRLES